MKRRAPPSPKTATSNAPNGEPTLSLNIQAKIGKQIAKAYEDVLKQEVPDRFRSLLERFDRDAKQQ